MHDENYQDEQGCPITLEALCRQNPEWAVSTHRHLRETDTALRAEIGMLRERLDCEREARQDETKRANALAAKLDLVCTSLEGAGWHQAAALMRSEMRTKGESTTAR